MTPLTPPEPSIRDGTIEPTATGAVLRFERRLAPSDVERCGRRSPNRRGSPTGGCPSMPTSPSTSARAD